MTTKIEWADLVWNWATGCDKHSKGCLNCYMFELAIKLKMWGQEKYNNGNKFTLHPQLYDEPLSYAKKPKKHKIVFVNSMSDSLHPKVTDEVLKRIFAVMNTMDKNPNYTFLLLTKRAKRIPELNDLVTFTDNIFMGVTIEHSDYNYRADLLRQSNAKYKFISAEPLLDDLHGLNLQDIDWLIVGGESGKKNKIRKMDLDWSKLLLAKCHLFNPPTTFFYKQGGSLNKCPIEHKNCKAKSKGCQMLMGKYYQNFPQSRQYQVQWLKNIDPIVIPNLLEQINNSR